MPLQSIAYDYGTPQFPKIQNKEGRHSYAKELSSFFKNLDEYIPSLSPSQKEWLDKELKEYDRSKNISRYWQISGTKEYRINSIKIHIDSISLVLELIPKSKILQNEIYLWSLISEELLKVDFWSSLHILIEEHGIVDKKIFYSDPSKSIDQYGFYLNNATIQASQIISNIIQPYLNGKMNR